MLQQYLGLPAQQESSRPRQQRRSSGSSSHSSLGGETTAPPADTEDSVVLSNLMRTGEASRLRRRGAMRASHHTPNRHQHISFDPEHDSDDESVPNRYSSGFRERAYQQPSSSRWGNDIGEQEYDDEEPSYILVCGGAVVPATWDGDLDPFEPSVLPVEPTKSSSISQYSDSHRVTNGCGAIVHLNASLSTSSRGPSKTYIARSTATESVVSLSAEYFQEWPGVKFEISSCGCIKEGIGCSFCGNALGTRWIFCKTMAEGRRKAPWRRSVPLRPEGPRYWQGTRSRSSSRSRDEPCLPIATPPQDDQTELYTFFGTAITAYRDEVEPTPKRPIPMPPTEPNSPISSPVFAPASPFYQQPIWRSPAQDVGGDQEAGSDSHPMSFPRRSLAINVEVTVASSVSYPERLRYRPLSDSTTSTMVPSRPTLLSTQSAPSLIYGYQMSASPEPLELSLPDVAADPVPPGPIRIAQVESSPIQFATELSDDENDDGQPMSFYHEQILNASQREQRGVSWAGDSDDSNTVVDRGENFDHVNGMFPFDR